MSKLTEETKHAGSAFEIDTNNYHAQLHRQLTLRTANDDLL